MGYDIHIMIVQENWLAPPTPITRENLLNWAQSQAQYTLAPQPDQTISIAYNGQDNTPVDFAWWEPSGMIHAKNPSYEETCRLVRISHHFLADTIGDEGEYYFLENDRLVAKSASGSLLPNQPQDRLHPIFDEKRERRKKHFIITLLILCAFIVLAKLVLWLLAIPQ